MDIIKKYEIDRDKFISNMVWLMNYIKEQFCFAIEFDQMKLILVKDASDSTKKRYNKWLEFFKQNHNKFKIDEKYKIISTNVMLKLEYYIADIRKSEMDNILFSADMPRIACVIDDLIITSLTSMNRKLIISNILKVYNESIDHYIFQANNESTINDILENHREFVDGSMRRDTIYGIIGKLSCSRYNFINILKKMTVDYLDICIGLNGLKLQPYIILFITNEIKYKMTDYINFHLMSDSHKIQIANNVRTFHDRFPRFIV